MDVQWALPSPKPMGMTQCLFDYFQSRLLYRRTGSSSGQDHQGQRPGVMRQYIHQVVGYGHWWHALSMAWTVPRRRQWPSIDTIFRNRLWEVWNTACTWMGGWGSHREATWTKRDVKRSENSSGSGDGLGGSGSARCGPLFNSHLGPKLWSC